MNTLTQLPVSLLLLSSVTLCLATEDNRTFHLLDSQSNPVMSGSRVCVDTRVANDPKALFPECGDVADGDDADDDGDGVNNDQDYCPGTPQGVKVDAKGCPLDTDKDGVPDYRDKCPNSPAGAKVDADGCQIVHGLSTERTTLDTTTTLLYSDILFGFDKAVLTTKGKQTLDLWVAEHKSTQLGKVYLEGHTDSVGSVAYNQKLSLRRAKTVQSYLVKRGIPVEQLMVDGKGENQPRVSNATAAGRAQNRRVELKIMP